MIRREIGEGRRPSWLPAVALSVAILAGLIEPLVAMPYRVSAGYNEGWNALWSEAALSGGVLYPAPAAPIANNYPPLSFYLVGGLGRMLGDNILAGRIVSFASIIGIAWLLFAWLRVAGTSRPVAAFGGAVFLAALAGYAPGYIAFDDPQLLAHAVMLGGLLLLWRGQFSVRTVALSAAIMVCGGFIKHLLLPLPLATTVWLAIDRRERLGAWLLGAAVTASALFTASWVAFGANFFLDVFARRRYDLPVALRETASAGLHLAPMLVLTAVAVAEVRLIESVAQEGAARLVAWYAAWAAAVGIAASTAVGVNVNAFFDLLIACSLGSAFGLEVLASLSVSSPAVIGAVATAAPWIAAATLGALIAIRIPAELSALAQLSWHERETAEDIRILRALGRGHAACEESALCYWAGSRFEMDVFNFGEKLATGTLPASACEQFFGAPSVTVLQLKPRTASETPRLPAACSQVIRRQFTPIRKSSNGEILVRNRSESRTGS